MAKWDKFIEANFEVKGTSGEERVCVCPWHEDKGKPNLYVNSVKGVYICHACGERGHLSKLGQTPIAELSDVRKRIKELKRSIRTGDQEDKEVVHPERWLDQYNFEHEYWQEARGFKKSTIKSFRLGYDPLEDELTIPLRDSHGKVLGISRRVLDGSKPKYKEPPRFKKGKHLFGAWKVRWLNLKRVALCEGPLDAVALWDAGVPALGMHGAYLTQFQARLLRSLGVHTVVAFLDNDKAGIGWPAHRSDPDDHGHCQVCGRPKSKKNDDHLSAGVHRVHEVLKNSGITVEVARYRRTRAKDPGELTESQRNEFFDNAIGFHQWKELQ